LKQLQRFVALFFEIAVGGSSSNDLVLSQS
jgi:hypothetical protein